MKLPKLPRHIQRTAILVIGIASLICILILLGIAAYLFFTMSREVVK